MATEDEEDRDDLEPEDEDEDDNGTEGASGDEDEYEPPTKEEWDRTRAALAKTKQEARKHRLALKEARNNASQGASGDSEAAKAAAEKAADEKYLPRIKRSAVKTALVAAGLADADKADVLKAAVRLVDLEDLDVDEDGDVDGVDDAVAELKSKFPGMFTKTRAPRGKVSTGSRGSGSSSGTEKPKTSSASRLAAGLKRG